MKRLALVPIIFAVCFSVSAQESAGSYKNRVTAGVGLQSDWMLFLDAGYHRMLTPWLGLGGGVIVFNEVEDSKLPHGTLTQVEGFDHWESEDRVDDKAAFKLSALFSPDLFALGRWKFGVDVEPGLLMALPRARQRIAFGKGAGDPSETHTYKVTGGQRFSWQCNAGIRFTNKRLSLGLGYGISGLDAYSSARLLEVEGTTFDRFYPEKSSVVQKMYCFIGFSF